MTISPPSLVRMMATSFTSLTDWIPGLATVYDAKAATITNGLNTYTFDRAYDWSGSDNDSGVHGSGAFSGCTI